MLKFSQTRGSHGRDVQLMSTLVVLLRTSRLLMGEMGHLWSIQLMKAKNKGLMILAIAQHGWGMVWLEIYIIKAVVALHQKRMQVKYEMLFFCMKGLFKISSSVLKHLTSAMHKHRQVLCSILLDWLPFPFSQFCISPFHFPCFQSQNQYAVPFPMSQAYYSSAYFSSATTGQQQVKIDFIYTTYLEKLTKLQCSVSVFFYLQQPLMCLWLFIPTCSMSYVYELWTGSSACICWQHVSICGI